MKKCSICNQDLTSKALDIYKMLNEEEATRLEGVRKNRGICSSCSIEMIMANIGF